MPVTRKTTRSEAGRFQSGVSGNPAGRPPGPVRLQRMTAVFGQENAELLLGAALAHAIQNPAACLELTKRVFGDDWRHPDVRNMPGRLDSLDDCRAAEHRAFHEWAYERIPHARYLELIRLVDARRDELTATGPDVPGVSALEPETPSGTA